MTSDQVRDVKALTRAAGISPTTTRLTSSSHPILTELAPGERSTPGGLVVPEQRPGNGGQPGARNSSGSRSRRPRNGSGRPRNGGSLPRVALPVLPAVATVVERRPVASPYPCRLTPAPFRQGKFPDCHFAQVATCEEWQFAVLPWETGRGRR